MRFLFYFYAYITVRGGGGHKSDILGRFVILYKAAIFSPDPSLRTAGLGIKENFKIIS